MASTGEHLRARAAHVEAPAAPEAAAEGDEGASAAPAAAAAAAPTAAGAPSATRDEETILVGEISVAKKIISALKK
ncbi:hypothetical protein MNEG_13137, partial [Monoraphidium neglectum]